MPSGGRLDWKKFGLVLKHLREASDTGLREAARHSGIDKAAWSRAENGKPVSVVNYLALCAWMEMHPFRHFRS